MTERYLPSMPLLSIISGALRAEFDSFNRNTNWYGESQRKSRIIRRQFEDSCRTEKQYSPTFRLLYQARSLPNRALQREKSRLSKEVQHLKWRYDRCATKAELWLDARDTCVRHRVSEDDSRWNDGPFPVYSRTVCWIVPECKRLIPHSFGFSCAWNRGHSWKNQNKIIMLIIKEKVR